MIVLFQTHQPHENGNQLDDVCVGDRVEAAVEGVDDGDAGRGDDGRLQGQVGDDGEGGALVILVVQDMKQGYGCRCST